MTPPAVLLPDEIVDHILNLALTIPEETFRAWPTPQTYAGTPPLKLHGILATSSQWYRVGKPYLYEAAILRTTQQVHGFCDAICQDHSDETPARYLRRLRVDGGYCTELGTIFRTAGSQITELFLGFDVSIDDHLDDILESLAQVNPSRLFLDGSYVKHDAPLAHVHALSDAIAHAAPGWSKLRRTDVGPRFPLPDELLESLFALPQVEYISGTLDPDAEDLTFEWLDDIVRPILERPTLKVLQLRNGKEWISLNLSTWGVGSLGVREKLFLGEGKDMVSLAEFPEQDVIVPEPTSLPELPDKIWARILWIATHYDGYDPNTDNYETIVWAYRADRTPLETGLQVLCVCKRFHRIGLEHLYSHPFLHPKNTDRFLRRVQESPDLAALIRVLYVDPNPPADQPTAISNKEFSAPLVNLVRVNSGIQVFPHLLKFVQEDGVVPLELLEQCIAPPDMRRQRLDPTDMIVPSMFLKLPHLRRVILTGGRAGRLGEAPHVDLPQLECLHLYEPGLGLTKLFRDMNLPRLREFGFKATSQAAVTVRDFLKVHGAKLSVLTINFYGTEDFKQPIFDHCPNVTELRLEARGSSLPALVPFFDKSKPHQRIERITLPGVSLTRTAPSFALEAFPKRMKELNPLKPWMPLIGFLSEQRDKLPALAEVRILGELDWPINRWQYNQRVVWPATSVALKLHELGISLADKTGTRWCRFDVDHTSSTADLDVASEHSDTHPDIVNRVFVL